jgi:hypothetical protein
LNDFDLDRSAPGFARGELKGKVREYDAESLSESRWVRMVDSRPDSSR